jgi:hypothetical protein
MKNIEQKLEKVAKQVEGSVYKNYSGRFMFGEKCWGIVCRDVNSCIEAAARYKFTGARTDNMGLKYIVYWPKLLST